MTGRLRGSRRTRRSRASSRWAVRRSSALAALCILLFAARALAQTGGARWDPEDRVLIGDFSVARSLAHGPTRLFVATDAGLVVYDEVRARFELPFTLEDGYPAAGVSAAAYDGRSGDLWLAARDGALLEVDPFSRRVRQRRNVGLRIDRLVPGPPSGQELFAHTGRGWVRLDTFTGLTGPATPAEVRQAVQASPELRRREELLRDPGFQSLSGFLQRGPGGLATPITDVMPSNRPQVFWVSTAGAFVYRYDRLSRDWSRLSYGYLGLGAGAVVADSGHLWFGPAEPLNGRTAVARADTALQRWEVWDPDSSLSAPRGAMRAALATGDRIWIGGERGLYWHDAQGGAGGWTRLSGADGLPDERVTALAPDEGGRLWVGTRRGLVRLSADGSRASGVLLVDETIRALAEGAGRLWVGTDHGLFGLEIGGEGQARSELVFPDPCGAVTTSGDSVWAGRSGEVWIRDASRSWRRLGVVPTASGPVTALADRSGVLWIGSADGLVRWDAAAHALDRATFAAGDLPAGPGQRAIRALVPVGKREVWAALPAGALRIRMVR